ncbi:MAG: peptide transporter permease [Frondihabitans sp.]|nr:peptide transporter permease [Frondihabitans sp.]
MTASAVIGTVPTDGRRSSGGGRVASRAFWLVRHADITLSVLVLLTVVLWAVIPEAFTRVNPLTVVPELKLHGPETGHVFGTDYLGRDLYSRVIYGARSSLLGSAIAVLVGLFVGSALGSVAGWFGGAVDTVIMRLIDVVLSIPAFLFAITIVVLLGFGIVNAAIAVGLSSSAAFARLIRAEVLKSRTSPYVEAATSSGTRPWGILLQHVLPNSLAPSLSLVTLQFGTAIIWIASLSFLGLGAQPPAPEWGLLVSEGRDYIASRYWLILYPSLTIVLVVLATNRLSHFLSARRHA